MKKIFLLGIGFCLCTAIFSCTPELLENERQPQSCCDDEGSIDPPPPPPPPPGDDGTDGGDDDGNDAGN